MSEANKNLIRRYQEAYNNGDLDALDEILSPDWATNAWPEGMPQSIESAKEFQTMARSIFPDLHYTTEALIAEGDEVVQRFTMRGTHKGELIGIAPTGRQVTVSGVSIFHIANGRIVKHWAFADDLGFLEQLGAELPDEWLAFRHRTSD